MTEAQFVIRPIVLALFGGAALFCCVSWIRRPERRLWAIPPLSLSLHITLFYAVVMSRLPFSLEALNLWSGALRIHEGILFAFGCWLYLWPARGRR